MADVVSTTLNRRPDPSCFTAMGWHGEDSVTLAIAAHARRAPGAVAVASRFEALTYGSLEARSSQLAGYLRTLGIGAGSIVGLCVDRSPALIVGALAIMKAGGAYLAMDPAYPPDRLAFMLRDSGAPVLVAQQRTAAHLPQGAWSTVKLDADAQSIAAHPSHAAFPGPAPEDPAYAIYTSGSTGVPKGVPISHAALMNLVRWHQRAFTVTPSDRASHLAGLGFDAAVWEIWPYLASGASLHMAPEDVRTDAALLQGWLVAEGITAAFVPTVLAERLIVSTWPDSTRLRVLLTGGDALHHRPAPHLPFRVVNNYGPTECTVVATSGAVAPGEGVPSIGKPIDNVRVYILDEDLQKVPEGTAGELHIAGPTLSRGYLNRPDLTAEKFLRDPFENDSGAVMYKTGDLAQWLPGGEIAFLGRADEQIKIRGYRIEPAEITAAIQSHPRVKDSLVMARPDAQGEKELIAYVVPSGTGPTLEELRESVRRRLPEYMMPRWFVRVDALPVTPNGKIDRAALPVPDERNTLGARSLDVPRNDTEARLAAIVAGLLHVDSLGVGENFFMLGGNSLLGAQIIAAVRGAFGVPLALRTLFGNPTVAGLAAEVERLAGAQGVRQA